MLVALVAHLAPDEVLAQAERIEWPTVGGVAPARRVVLGAPELVIGAATADRSTLLSGVIGAARLPGGGVVVGDASAHRLLFFDSTGQLVREAGRAGDGPGELRLPRWLGRCGDGTIGVFDAARNAVSHFSVDGTFLRAASLPAIVSFDTPVACFGPGDYHFLLNRIRTQVGPGDRLAIPAAVIRIRDASSVDTIFSGGIQEYYTARAISAYADVPLGEATLAALGGRTLLIATTQAGRLLVLDASGHRQVEVSLPIARRRVSARDWERAKEARISTEPLRQSQEIIARVLSEIPRPAEFPRIDQIQVDQDGRPWVRTFDNFDRQIATWLILDRDGVPRAALAAPRGLRILEIGRGFLLGVARDSDGVERVELYSFPPLP